jgi:TonB family protein
MILPSPCLCLFALCVSPLALSAQESAPAPQATPLAVTFRYPDNTGGLEKLAKDILKAQKESDTALAGQLLQSLVLPHARSWYAEKFGDAAAANEGAAYEEGSNGIPPQLANFFLKMYAEHSTSPTAVRFEKSCDENTSELVFNVLQDRVAPVPLYELRFYSGNQFFRLSLFAFVDGEFRFVVPPKSGGRRPQKSAPSAPSEKPDKEATPDAGQIRMGGNVIAAKLIKKVQPAYPAKARDERLQGTVRFQAIIAKDGTIAQLHLEKGVCSLAQAGFDAVRQWRYSPTLLMGQPVEVVTTIDVIFELRQ